MNRDKDRREMSERGLLHLRSETNTWLSAGIMQVYTYRYTIEGINDATTFRSLLDFGSVACIEE